MAEIPRKFRTLPLMEAAMRSHGRDIEVKDREIRELRRAGGVLIGYLKKLSAGMDLKLRELRPVEDAIRTFVTKEIAP